MTERFANDIATTLNGTITSGATSLVVASSTGFPAVNFRVRIDDEYLLVTAVAGTTWTVTRGQEGSAAAAHSNGAAVTHVLTAGGLVQAISEVTQSGFATSVAGTVTTTSGSYADLTGMSVTLTTDGGDLLVFFVGAFANTNVGAAIVTALKLDAAAEVGAFSLNTNVANYVFMGVNTYCFTGVPAGSHTIKVRWLTNVGTASSNGNDRYLLAVELK